MYIIRLTYQPSNCVIMHVNDRHFGIGLFLEGCISKKSTEHCAEAHRVTTATPHEVTASRWVSRYRATTTLFCNAFGTGVTYFLDKSGRCQCRHERLFSTSWKCQKQAKSTILEEILFTIKSRLLDTWKIPLVIIFTITYSNKIIIKSQYCVTLRMVECQFDLSRTTCTKPQQTEKCY